MYAIIVTGGKQYKVEAGQELFVEKLVAEEESEVVFDRVLSVSNGETLIVGAPFVEGAAVRAQVLKHGKGKKITVFTYKPKKNEKRKMGHRKHYTKVEIQAIELGNRNQD